MPPDHPSSTAESTVLPNATIGYVQNSDIAGRDIVEQEGTNNVIGNNNVVGNQTVVVGDPNSRDPIQRLLYYCALDALVDSKERHDWEQFLPPRCAPETRQAILQIIIRWVEQGPSSPDFLWLTGSAGSGKSAICQTITEIFKRQGTLLANFFFSRGAGSSGRSNGYRLLPTIIWQIQKNLPETKSLINAAIRNDVSILTSTPATQMETLFCNPLKRSALDRWLRDLFRKHIRLVVIDGLDECQGSGVQQDLLRVIADTATKLRLPLRFLIASRPEAHITETFHNHPHLMKAAENRIGLDEDQDAQISIFKFVQARFREILATHPSREALLEASWPSEEVVAFIVSKSSPQFVFASTVMNYISSHEDRPDQRLDTIFAIIETKTEDSEAPLENLDKLYRFILSGVRSKYLSSVWTILGVIYLAGRQEFEVPIPSPKFFEGLAGLHSGTVTIGLRPLLSIISIPQDYDKPIKSLHASLFDFLLNRQRSRNTVLDLEPAHSCLFDYYGRNAFWLTGPPARFLGILRHAIPLLPANKRRPLIEPLITGLFHSIEKTEIQNADPHGNMTEAFTVIRLLSKVGTKYGTNEESYGHSRLFETANRLPADIQNPFTTPLSKAKHRAFVRIVISYRLAGLDTPWHRPSGSLFVPQDTETLMHLITAFATEAARITQEIGDDVRYCEGLKALIRVGDSLAVEKSNTEEELLAVCCKSVICFCDLILRHFESDKLHFKLARRALEIWTCLGSQEGGSISS